MIFFQIKESLSLLCLHIGTPNQHLTQKPVPISEIKISFSNLRKKKRKVTPSDDSWIDSFDPRPMKQRRETTVKDKLDFATKLRKIDPLSKKNPLTDLSLTGKNFSDQKEFQESQVYPEAIEYGITEENGAKFYYSKVSEKQHCSSEFEEPLIISGHYSWMGASLDGIRKCLWCDPTALEIKCPFKRK
ncbi:hypothetical protein P5673_008005 [Acropora cervicornis]|uniref:YqaJ viral recombinase domain-containing protein n=1 Tax=Acropora cervicornis TaxID=6130 RepID=A0AAD9QV75_ACRCE|nr:hypothetical protein P5673_008005 [Acropora cervicornis]